MFRSQILAKLVATYPGLSKHLLGLVADKLAPKVTEETQIEGAIAGLNDLPISLQDYATFLQKEGDRRVTEAQKKTKNDEPTGDDNDDDSPKQDNKGKQKGGDDTISKLSQQVAALSQQITGFQTSQQQQTLSQKLNAKLTEKKIPVTLSKGRVIEKEEDLDTILAEIEADYAELKQGLVNEGFSQNTNPGGSNVVNVGQKKVEGDIEAWSKQHANTAQAATKTV